MISRAQLVFILGALLALFGAATVTVLLDADWRHYLDSAVYLITAGNLAEGDGYVHLGEPFFLRPPGLAWLLSPFVERPFDPTDALPLHAVIHVSAAATFLFLALALRRLHGTLQALVITLLFALNPLSLGLYNSVFSEFPHLALFFAGAWLLLPDRAGADGRPVGWARALAGACCLGASCWFRTIGLLAVPALGLAAWAGGEAGRRQRVLRGLVAGGLTLALILPWLTHARQAAATAPRPTTQLLTFDHATGLFHVDPRDPDSPRLGLDDWLARIAANVDDVSVGLAQALLGTGGDWARIRVDESRLAGPGRQGSPWMARGLALTLALCVLTTWLTRRSLLDWYLVLYVAVVLVWFTFVQRMLLPLLPLLLSALVHTLDRLGRHLGRRLKRDGLADGLLATVAGLLLLASLVRMQDALTPGADRDVLARTERRAARWIANNTAPEDVVLHERAAIIQLLTGRTAYTWRNLPTSWPEGCPPTDWALYGPQDKYPEVHTALKAAAIESSAIPFDFLGRPGAIHIYRLDRP